MAYITSVGALAAAVAILFVLKQKQQDLLVGAVSGPALVVGLHPQEHAALLHVPDTPLHTDCCIQGAYGTWARGSTMQAFMKYCCWARLVAALLPSSPPCCCHAGHCGAVSVDTGQRPGAVADQVKLITSG